MSCELTNVYDLCILQNQTYRLPLTFKNDDGSPIDLSAWSFTGSIKEKFTDTVPVLNFTVEIISAVSGSIALYLSADTTWTLTKPKYVYDLIGTNTTPNPDETLRMMQGKVSVKPGVTEP